MTPPTPAQDRPEPLVTAIETALSDTVAWRHPAYLSDTVQSLVAAGEYRKAAEVMAPRIRSLVDLSEHEWERTSDYAATSNQMRQALEACEEAAATRADLARYEGRVEAFDAVLDYLRSINGNGRDEPSDSALDAVLDKITDLRSRATAALAALAAKLRETPR